MLDAAELAIGFISTRSWADSYQFCRDHPEVLGSDVDQALAELEQRSEREGDAAMRDTARRMRSILATCRRDGLDLGYANARLEHAQRQLAAANGADRADLLTLVMKTWFERFEITGDQADLDHAVEFAEQAAKAAPGDYMALANLADMEELRFRRFGDLWDMISMADHQRAAVRAGRNAPRSDQYELQLHLAQRSYLQAEVTRRHSALDQKSAREMTTEAVEAAQMALRLAESDSEERFHGLPALVDAVQLRYVIFGSLEDLDLAITALDELASSRVGSQRALLALRGLAVNWRERSNRTNSVDDLQRAVQALIRWLEGTPLDAPDRARAVVDLEEWQAQLNARGR